MNNISQKPLFRKTVSVLLSMLILTSVLVVGFTINSVAKSGSEDLSKIEFNFDTVNPKTKTAMDDNCLGISETALSNGSNGYLYCDNTTSNAQSRNWDNTQLTLENGKTYTVSFDFYILNFSTAKTLFAVQIAGKDDYPPNAWYNKYQWYTYTKSFAVSNASAGFKLFGYQGAKFVIDNLKITDESGNIKLDEKFDTATSGTVFKHIDDKKILTLLGDSDTNTNKSIYLSADNSASSAAKEVNITFPASQTLTTVGGIGLTFSYRVIKPNTSGAPSDIYTKINGTTQQYKDIEALSGYKKGEWCEGYYYVANSTDVSKDIVLTLGMYPGVKIEFDNLKLRVNNQTGAVISEVNFENNTVFSGTIASLVDKRVIAQHYLLADNSASSAAKEVNITFPASQTLTTVGGIGLTFSYRVIKPNTSGAPSDIYTKINGTTQQYKDIEALSGYKKGEWCEGYYYVANSTDVSKDIVLTLGMYPGVKIEFDNLKLRVNNQTGAVISEVNFESNATVSGAIASIVTEEPQKEGYPWYNKTNGVLDINAESADKAYTLTDKLENNTEYLVKFSYKQAVAATSGNDLFMLMNGESITKTIVNESPVTDVWQDVEFVFKATNAAYKLYVEKGAEVYFDKIIIRKINYFIDFDEPNNDYYPASLRFSQKAHSELPDKYKSNPDFTSDGYLYGDFTSGTSGQVAYMSIGGIDFVANHSYEVSVDYYVSETYSNKYRMAFGYNKVLTTGTDENNFVYFSNNNTSTGWKSAKFTFTPTKNGFSTKGIVIALYAGFDFVFDNLRAKEICKINTSADTAEQGSVTASCSVDLNSNVTVIAKPFNGCTFVGWYENGALVSNKKEYSFIATTSRNLSAKFDGEAVAPEVFRQGFEDEVTGTLMDNCYEILNNPSLAHSGNKVLHVFDTKLTVQKDHSVFFDLVRNVDFNIKPDTEYDLYVWIKWKNTPQSSIYLSAVNETDSGARSQLSQNWFKPSEYSKWLEEKGENGWYRFKLATLTRAFINENNVSIQVCKGTIYSSVTSIDELYIDDFELVERKKDYANMRFTEKFFNIVPNADFESNITTENWGPLSSGMSVETVNGEAWQGKKALKVNASNGINYVKKINIKANTLYTFGASAKLSQNSDIKLGLYADGSYTPFKSICDGENGTVKLTDNNQWSRTGFTFESGNSSVAYLVISGSKGELWLDNIEIFLASRGYSEDPNDYNVYGTESYNFAEPEIFKPTKIINVEYVDEEVVTQETVTEEIKGYYKKPVTTTSTQANLLWLWILIAVLVILAIVTLVVILIVKKRNRKV